MEGSGKQTHTYDSVLCSKMEECYILQSMIEARDDSENSMGERRRNAEKLERLKFDHCDNAAPHEDCPEVKRRGEQ